MADNDRGPDSGVTPYLTIKGGRCGEAIDWYVKVLGAEEVFRGPAEDGKRLMHSYIKLNSGAVLMSDDFPDWNGGRESPDPGGYTLHLQVPDAGALFAKALANGAVETIPLAEQFWGDLYGKIRDPFGVSWSIATTPGR